MWEKSSRNIFFVEKGIALPKNDALFVTGAIAEDRRCYAIFHKNDRNRELALFGGELEADQGRPELIEQGAAAIKNDGWRQVIGPNGQPWFIVLARKVTKKEPWGTVRLAPCISDLGGLGWCLFNDGGVLLYSFEYRHQEGRDPKRVTPSQEVALWYLAMELLWGKKKGTEQQSVS